MSYLHMRVSHARIPVLKSYPPVVGNSGLPPSIENAAAICVQGGLLRQRAIDSGPSTTGPSTRHRRQTGRDTRMACPF